MFRLILLLGLVSGAVLNFVASTNDAADQANIEFAVLDKGSRKPMPCRIHLKDAAGKAQRAGDLPFWNDHFVCPGTVQMKLAPGKYSFEIERGPEYRMASGTVMA